MIARDAVLWVSRPTYEEILGLLTGRLRIFCVRKVDGQEQIDLAGIAIMQRDAEQACEGMDS